MNFDIFFDNPPLVHGGGTKLWSIDPLALRYIIDIVDINGVSLETGLGLSTAIFSSLSKTHIAIVPDPREVELFKSHYSEFGLTFSSFEPRVGFSQVILPTLELQNIDFALIDGGHGFPIPFFDFYYISTMIKVNGFLIIDDTQLWTGDIICKYLNKSDSWVLVKKFPRTAIYKKNKFFEFKEWNEQVFDLEYSRNLILKYKILTVFRHLVKLDFIYLVKKFFSNR